MAEKIIKKYPKAQYPKLFELAHRIIHERPCKIEIPTNNLKEIDKAFKEVHNTAENAKGTRWEKTTVWNAS